MKCKTLEPRLISTGMNVSNHQHGHITTSCCSVTAHQWKAARSAVHKSKAAVYLLWSSCTWELDWNYILRPHMYL